jgi:hypothetical protein
MEVFDTVEFRNWMKIYAKYPPKMIILPKVEPLKNAQVEDDIVHSEL